MKRAFTVALLIALFEPADGSDSLRSTFETLRPRLASSAFGRPLILESSEADSRVRGDVFSVVNHSFRAVTAGLDTPGEWCEVLILHLNVKSCDTSQTGKESSLQLSLGTKRGSRADGGQRLAFRFRVVEASADRLRVTMQADDGPLGTHDYLLSLEATPTAPDQSFVHLAYAYSFSATARLAMSGYLHTLGENKVGFTVAGRGVDGQPVYVGGVRGALERNTMRYYLGMETFLASAAMRPPGNRRWRLSAWFDATEKYARQLHELTKDEYLAGKEPGPGVSGQ
jgi:hypothetical protein